MVSRELSWCTSACRRVAGRIANGEHVTKMLPARMHRVRRLTIRSSMDSVSGLASPPAGSESGSAPATEGEAEPASGSVGGDGGYGAAAEAEVVGDPDADDAAEAEEADEG